MHYYQFNIAAFALHTSHLTLEEEGVYRRLLDFYYDTELPIPKETQPVIRRLRLGSHSDIFNSILEEFFTLEADGWHNNRADIEIKDYQEKAEIARANGRKGGRPRKNKGQETQPVILANPEITDSKANYELLTKNQELLTSSKDKPKAKRFAPPTRQEVVDYMFGRDNTYAHGEESEKFIDYYTANGWKVGKNPMKDWKAAIRNWMKNNYAKQQRVQTAADRRSERWENTFDPEKATRF